MQHQDNNPQQQGQRDKLWVPGDPLAAIAGGLGDASLSAHGYSSSREAKLKLLTQMQRDVEEVARGYGLDFFPQHFEVVNYEQLKIIVAQTGFPKKYLHMRTGLEYEQYDRKYTFGLAKVYELVINNNPCVGYLLDSNSLMEQRLVMAHVYGHNDFFKNNAYFRATDRKMLDTMGEHASRVQRLMSIHGEDKIEQFFDACLSIDDLIDPLTVVSGPRKFGPRSLLEAPQADPAPKPRRYDSPVDYMDRFINPPDLIRDEERRLREAHQKEAEGLVAKPERDVLLYLLENAPLTPWEQEVLSIVRDEAYYFAPQRMTKIMNEGWASYWHNKMMTEVLLQSHNCELIDYATANAGVLRQPQGGLNPYRLGVRLFEDIEERWDKGKFGIEWERCENRHERENWDRKLGQGRDKIFEVRAAYNDVTFVREFLTPELAAREKLFEFERDDESYEITSRKFEDVRNSLVASLVNSGRPVIEVLSGNYRNAKELVLVHRHDGRELDMQKAQAVLENVQKLWKRPVHIMTYHDDEKLLLSFDGKKHTQTPSFE